MKYFLGVDGGNTKTLALIADETGLIVGKGRAGNGDIYGAESANAAVGEITKAMDLSLADAGLVASDLESSGYSLAGADWAEDYVFLQREILSARFNRGIGPKMAIVNDAQGALCAGAPDGLGVAVICGTYGTCAAVGPEEGKLKVRRQWQGSFWHEAQGGAVPLGNSVLSAVVHSRLGMIGPTSLTDLVLGHYGAPTVDELLHWLNRREDPVPKKAGQLARMVLAEALKGDAVSNRIVTEHGERAGDYAIAAANAVGYIDEPFMLVLAGGVLRSTPNPLADIIVARVKTQFPQVQAAQALFEPVYGGLMVAYSAANFAIDDKMRQRFRETHPDPSFFDS